MTLKQILEMDAKAYKKLSVPELREALVLMERYARKRVNSLHQRGKFSYAAYRNLGINTLDKKWDDVLARKTDFSDKNESWLRGEFKSYYEFLNSKTSTVTGVKEYEKKLDMAIFGRTREKGRTVPLHQMTEMERRKFWDLYNEFIRSKAGASSMWVRSDKVMATFYVTMVSGNWGNDYQRLFDIAEANLNIRQLHFLTWRICRMELTLGVTNELDFYKSLIGLPICQDGKTEKKFYNVPAAFDIEVTSFMHNGEKRAIMYAWVFGINGKVIIGRTWDEFLNVYKIVTAILHTQDTTLCVYVHNLSYEFQFIRKLFNWENVFSLEERKPVYARTTEGVEFRCSYRLTGKALKDVGDDIQNKSIKKMVGDLDYEKLRHSKTPLTPEELRYIEYDCRVVMELISDKIVQDGNIS